VAILDPIVFQHRRGMDVRQQSLGIAVHLPLQGANSGRMRVIRELS
jgi:hypothetical protein